MGELIEKKLSKTFFTEQCIIYLDPNSLDLSVRKILKKLICITGGMYVNFINPCLTHILVGQITEDEHRLFQSYGNVSQVLRV